MYNDNDIINFFRDMKSIGDICKENNIDPSNIVKLTASKKARHLVAIEIIKEYLKFLEKIILYKGDDFNE